MKPALPYYQNQTKTLQENHLVLTQAQTEQALIKLSKLDHGLVGFISGKQGWFNLRSVHVIPTNRLNAKNCMIVSTDAEKA